jgi:hypothetical protein
MSVRRSPAFASLQCEAEVRENRFRTPGGARWFPSVIDALLKKIEWTPADTARYIDEQQKAFEQAAFMLKNSFSLKSKDPTAEQLLKLYRELDTLHQCLISAGIGIVARNEEVSLATCGNSLLNLKKHAFLEGKGDGSVGEFGVVVNRLAEMTEKQQTKTLVKQIKNLVSAISNTLKRVEKYRFQNQSKNQRSKAKLTAASLFSRKKKKDNTFEFDNVSETEAGPTVKQNQIDDAKPKR